MEKPTFERIKQIIMKALKVILLTLLTSTAIHFAQAQTVEELQKKYFDALGGKAKLSAQKDMYQETSMEMMGMQMPSKLWIVFGKGMRQEIEIQAQKIVTFITKDSGWMINPMMGSNTPQPVPAEALKGYTAALTAGGDLASFGDNGYKATYEGKEDISGKPAYKIKLTKDSTSNVLYMDVATNYLVRSVVNVSAMGQQVEVVTNFSDYKKSPEGFVYPYSSIITNPMIGEIKATVIKLDFNKNLDIKDLQKTD